MRVINKMKVDSYKSVSLVIGGKTHCFGKGPAGRKQLYNFLRKNPTTDESRHKYWTKEAQKLFKKI